MTQLIETREEWLRELADMLRPVFACAGAPIPSNDRLWFSCSHMASGSRSNHIGECYQDARGAHIAIRPSLQDELSIAAVLVHELCHAALPMGTGHGPAFQKLAKRVGLVKPWTATVAGAALKESLFYLAAVLGPYPHPAPFEPYVKAQATPKHKNVSCPVCDFHAKVWAHQIKTHGRLTCPSCGPSQKLLTKDEKALVVC